MGQQGGVVHQIVERGCKEGLTLPFAFGIIVLSDEREYTT